MYATNFSIPAIFCETLPDYLYICVLLGGSETHSAVI